MDIDINAIIRTVTEAANKMELTPLLFLPESFTYFTESCLMTFWQYKSWFFGFNLFQLVRCCGFRKILNSKETPEGVRLRIAGFVKYDEITGFISTANQRRIVL
jgi:hypothetical protein